MKGPSRSRNRILAPAIGTLLLGACSFVFTGEKKNDGTGESPDADTTDAASDALNVPDARDPDCWDTAPLLDPDPSADCFTSLGAPIALSSGTYRLDTMTGDLKNPDGTDFTIDSQKFEVAGLTWLVITTNSFTMADSATLEVSGDFPLAIAAREGIEIASGSLLDVGSTAIRSGPGAVMPLNISANSCPQMGGLSANTSSAGLGNGGGGGGGGSGTGGNGGDSNDTAGAGGGAGFSAATYSGGCPGGLGGGNLNVASLGGGLLALMSDDTIKIDGLVNAGGAGGARGALAEPDTTFPGGNGGGSGGTILLDAPTVTIDGVVAANGGGGGGEEGAGSDGSPSLAQAAGGFGTASCPVCNGDNGRGGKGGAQGIISGEPGVHHFNLGAGGGGGGAGQVFLNTIGNQSELRIKCSPAATNPPALPPPS